MRKIAIIMAVLLSAAYAHAQTDSIGVYLISNGKANRVETIRYSQTKISGGFKSKAKLVFDSSTSQNRVSAPATFRLYFRMPAPQEVMQYYMFAPSYSAKDFSVGKFDIKKGKRYLTTAVVSITGSKVGASKADGIDIQHKLIRDGVYEVTVSGPAGEYCLMPTINGTAGYSGVFDFTITE